jgi:hypothetical protein
MKNIFKNVYLLYFIFLLTIINIGWLIYDKKYNKITIFFSSCLGVYIITKNMIFVLSISLILVNIIGFIKKEGFEDKDDKDDKDKDDKDKDDKDKDDKDKDDKDKDDKDKDDKDKDDKHDKDDELENEKKESIYMEDKSVIKKLKKLNPLVFETIKNMNANQIDEINETINKLKNIIDP